MKDKIKAVELISKASEFVLVVRLSDRITVCGSCSYPFMVDAEEKINETRWNEKWADEGD